MIADPTCSVAFKEWAAVCEALATGRQTIILRKGGLHEGGEGFRVKHRGFWLYPTKFHEQAQSLAADASGFAARALAAAPAAGSVAIGLYAAVHAVHEITSREAALRLAGQHIWADDTVRQRFAYRTPGMFLLVVRVFGRPSPVLVEEGPAMAGCKSWVDLPQPIPTGDLSAVLDDREFAARAAAVDSLLAPAAAAPYS